VPIWLLLAVAGAILALVSVTDGGSWAGLGVAAVLGLLLLIALNGFIVVQPNQAKVTWQVSDAAQAAFDVEDYKAFVDIQAETAVRHVASVFPYDSYEEGQESLRGAADMLRRQQADAIVAARQRIVEGAVGMVDHALSSLSERDIVDLDEERKAAMVSNLMVVLVSDRGAQPVVNSGSLYT